MSVHNFASAIRAGASGSSASTFYDYQIANSARFDDGDSSNMTRAQSTGNRKTYTFSAWLLRADLHSEMHIFSTVISGQDGFYFDSDNRMGLYTTGGGNNFISNRVFEDTAKWYHFHIAYDTTQASSSNRILVYVNGEALTWSSSSFPSQDAQGHINQSSGNLRLGYNANTDSNFYSGLMAEVHMIDGTNVPYTTFGETKSGVWIPKDPGTLSYGTNGFYLRFDNASALGNSTSPASNNLTVNNMGTDHQDTNTPTFDAGG
jgi:hypothetical protein